MEEQRKTFSLTLDMVRAVRTHPFEVVAGDTGNVLEITLQNDGVPVDLTGCYLCAVFRSGSGTALQDEESGLTVSEQTGVFSVALRPQSYSPGNVSVDVQLYSGADRRTLITSTRFNFRCRMALLSAETMRAQEAYPPLITATREAAAAASRADAAAAQAYAAGSAANEAEAQRAAAEQQRAAQFSEVLAASASHAAAAQSAAASAQTCLTAAQSAREDALAAMTAAQGAAPSGHTHTAAAVGAGQGTTTRAFGAGAAFSGGGGGGARAIGYEGAGGAAGGGRGANYRDNAEPGAANTGGGGGGGGGGGNNGTSTYSTQCRGAAGGSGIVILRNAR